MKRPQFVYIHESHLDLFWIGDYRYCLERGRHVIKQYVDRCMAYRDEAFLLETVVFLEYFLDRHPEYEPIVQELWRRGQLDIGAAYVDILEHLALGESQIRNIVRGKAWCREHLDIDTRLAAHADLPSLIPQVGQVYTQAQVPYYATSRKIFPNGAVWVHQSPDGTGRNSPPWREAQPSR
jgi:alpha-mannosidase